MMNKKNIFLAIAAVAFANGAVVCTEQEASVDKKKVVQAIAGTIIAIEQEVLEATEEVITNVVELVQEVTEEVVA